MRLLAALLVLLACTRITSTYPVFNSTYDEGHFVAGIEYLTEGRYTYDPTHPPLARIILALGPYLAGLRLLHKPDIWQEANAELQHDGRYWSNLALARMGVLPFFILANLVLWLWTNRLFGEHTALASVGLFTLLPPVLAHSGLATLDIPACAMIFLAAYSLDSLCTVAQGADRRSEPDSGPVSPDYRSALGRGAMAGLACAAAVLTKFSAVVFLPVLFGSVRFGSVRFGSVWFGSVRAGSLSRSEPASARAAVRSNGRLVQPLEVGIFVFVLLIALLYRWDLSGFYQGIWATFQHNSTGHASWLLGEYRSSGWWYFFPVVLAVKTPLGFIGLVMAGIWFMDGKGFKAVMPLLCASGILGVCMFSRINLGVRHILVIYPFLAMIAGWGFVAVYRSSSLWGIILGPALIGWTIASSVLAHPDYLAYFNELAPHPSYVLAESDLDWGQDLQRLSVKLKELGVEKVWLDYFGSADVSRFLVLPYEPLPPWKPVSGWVAISIHSQTIGAEMLRQQAQEQAMKLYPKLTFKRHPLPSPLEWLEKYKPVAMAGKSIRIYHIP